MIAKVYFGAPWLVSMHSRSRSKCMQGGGNPDKIAVVGKRRVMIGICSVTKLCLSIRQISKQVGKSRIVREGNLLRASVFTDFRFLTGSTLNFSRRRCSANLQVRRHNFLLLKWYRSFRSSTSSRIVHFPKHSRLRPRCAPH